MPGQLGSILRFQGPLGSGATTGRIALPASCPMLACTIVRRRDPAIPQADRSWAALGQSRQIWQEHRRAGAAPGPARRTSAQVTPENLRGFPLYAVEQR